MPEYLIALTLSAVLGSFGWIYRKVEGIDSRLDRFELRAAQTFVTRETLDRTFDRLEAHLIRMEDKIDAHVSGNPNRIESMRNKYNLSE